MPSAAALRAGKAIIELSLKSDKVAGQLKLLEAKLQQTGTAIASLGAKVLSLGAIMSTPFLVRHPASFGL